MASKLPNYLRTYRKRAGLSETEFAYLLGCKNASKVSRYERFDRIPTLKTALLCQAVLGTPIAELFAGMYQQAEKEVSKRAKELSGRLEEAGRLDERKRDVLRAIEITPAINKEHP
jgi:transcriptional regulator with XRE-family HTH domain